MDTLPKYLFCVGSQKLKIDTIFVQLRKTFYFPRAISNDLRATLTLTGVGYLNPKEALESMLTDIYDMMVLLPNDFKLVNVVITILKPKCNAQRTRAPH